MIFLGYDINQVEMFTTADTEMVLLLDTITLIRQADLLQHIINLSTHR